MFESTKTLFMFPGQGSQHVGMASEFMKIKETKEYFELADDTLSQNLTKLMRSGKEEDLALTENAQPALLLASYVAWIYLQQQTGQRLNTLCKYVAGHSLGEYSALCAARAFSLEDGLRLVKKRGQAMQQAVPVGEGTMAAVMGDLPIEKIEENLSKECWIANDNAEGQVVISGKVLDVDASIENMEHIGAKRVIKLDVSAPFHSPLMQPAADVMAEELENVPFNMPTVPIIQNISAKPVTNGEILKQGLVEQVCSQVKWRESMNFVAEDDITQLYELGAGKVLTGLAKRCNPALKATPLSTPEQIDTLLETLHKGR
jgi:[acyl-carrier-protein] S-malonyltransferase